MQETRAIPTEQLTVECGPKPRLWTREEYFRAAKLGLFRPDERLELIRGEIIQKMPQNRPHVIAIFKSTRVLEAIFRSGCHVVSQAPMRIPEDSEPEPDVMVIAGTPDDYSDHPTPADVLLLIEVSDSTLAYDRSDKAALYAQAGVAEYWIVNLPARLLEVFREPAALPNVPFGYGYRSQMLYTENDTVSPLAAPDATVRVADLLPQTNPTETER